MAGRANLIAPIRPHNGWTQAVQKIQQPDLQPLKNIDGKRFLVYLLK